MRTPANTFYNRSSARGQSTSVSSRLRKLRETRPEETRYLRFYLNLHHRSQTKARALLASSGEAARRAVLMQSTITPRTL